MKYYQTDENGHFIGAFDADVSPLEPEVRDEETGDVIQQAAYLVPAGGVTVPAPALAKNECARWDGKAWVIEPDFLGKVYYMPDHTRHVIEARGVPLPVGATDNDPPKTQAELDAEDSEKAKAELLALDLASIRDLRAYVAAKADAPQTLKDREALAISARAKVIK